MPPLSRHFALAVTAPPRILTKIVARQSRCLHGLAQAAPTTWRVQNRGKKTKASAKLDDLPQGLIPLDPLPLEDDAPVYSTVVRQARSNMQKFQNCVLLTRVGGFYELLFEQAVEFAPLLNIKQTLRPKTDIPMVFLLIAVWRLLLTG